MCAFIKIFMTPIFIRNVGDRSKINCPVSQINAYAELRLFYPACVCVSV